MLRRSSDTYNPAAGLDPGARERTADAKTGDIIAAKSLMKRDMDLCREILLCVEAREGSVGPEEVKIDGYTTDQIGYHAKLLADQRPLPAARREAGRPCALLAAILAHGCNLGLYTMEKVAPDIAYRRLKYVSDWCLVEENQRAALATIVHGIIPPRRQREPRRHPQRDAPQERLDQRSTKAGA